MYQVDEKPETIHLYVVREEKERPSLVPVFLTVFALSLIIAFGVLFPYQQPEIRTTIRVPAVLLPLKTFNASVAVTATDIKSYPATIAHGILTFTNGSILSEVLPKGMFFFGKDGIEVVANEAVYIPPGSANSFGRATVAAQVVRSGIQGNIPPLDINQVAGTSLYIQNLQPFTGGKDASTTTFITPQDRQNALFQARESLTQQTVVGLLLHPCQENARGNTSLIVTWTCQFVTYEAPPLPGVKVLHAQVAGKKILLEIVFVARPPKFETK